MVQEIHLVGRLDQDVKVSSISPRRLSSILQAVGSHGLGHQFLASPLSTFGPGKLSVMQNTIAGGCAVHSRVFSSSSLVSNHKIRVVPAPCNDDNTKCLQALPNVL